MITPEQWALGIGAALAIVCSAFFSLSETALLSVNRTRLRYLADHGDARARLALELLHKPRRLLATILIGNNIVNILASVLTTALAIQLFGDLALGIATGVLTFLLLVAGEITPKTFASEHASWAARHVARPVRFFVILFRPLERTLSWIARLLLRASGASRVKPVQFHTEEEIKVLLRIGQERGHIGQHEGQLIRAVFEFNDLELDDIYRPLEEAATVRPGDPLSRVPQLVAKTGHSRYPVLEPGTRKPLGLVFAKDLFLMAPETQRGMTVSSIIRSMPKFPPTHRVAAALEQMRKEGSQMAAVVGPHGDMIGLVTIEDLLEEIVGEIDDEFEAARRRLRKERAAMTGRQAETAAAPEGTSPPPT